MVAAAIAGTWVGGLAIAGLIAVFVVWAVVMLNCLAIAILYALVAGLASFGGRDLMVALGSLITLLTAGTALFFAVGIVIFGLPALLIAVPSS